MKFFRDLFDQLMQVWQRLDLRARILFGLVAAVSVLGIASVAYWSSQPQYVPLAVDLPPTEIAEIKSRLDSAGIQNELDYAGTSIRVPKHQFNLARIEAKELVGEQPVTADDSVSPPWSDPRELASRQMARKERILAATIERFQAVKKAQVHIAKPDASVFVRQEKPTKASVQLELRPGSQLSANEVESIAWAVANAVDGLNPENVSITDTLGRHYTTTDQGLNDVSQQLAARRDFERMLVQKAQTLLAAKLGPDRATITVNADLNFKTTTTKETVYDPDNKVKVKETLTNQESTNEALPPTGPAGAAPNTNPQAMATTRNGQGSKMVSEEIQTEFMNSMTSREHADPAGRITRLTVAAFVDLTPDAPPPAEGEDPAAAAAAATPAAPDVSLADIEALIATAVGLDRSRGDEIKVVSTKLQRNVDGEASVINTEWWDFARELTRNLSLGIAALVSLVIALLVLRKMKPITIPGMAASRTEDERARVIAELSARIRENPDTLKDIMAAWLADREPESSPGPKLRRAA